MPRPTTLAFATLAALDAGLAASSRPAAQRARTVTKSALMPLLGSGERRFLLGLGSFAAAHVGYIAAFSGSRDPCTSLREPGVRAAAALFAATGPGMAALAHRQDRTLAVPVLAYAGIISAMFATATTLDRSLPRAARRRIAAGSALFVLSDTLLGVGRFALPAGRGPLDTAVMATYTAGQWLIADGAAASQ
ncbi:MAG: lysoplasmalogenase [Actinobacteria bacterium]|nr:lysoplasmalogenase [Actinomycetota bacterium]